jgi:hypothetical protein
VCCYTQTTKQLAPITCHDLQFDRFDYYRRSDPDPYLRRGPFCDDEVKHRRHVHGAEVIAEGLVMKTIWFKDTKYIAHGQVVDALSDVEFVEGSIRSSPHTESHEHRLLCAGIHAVSLAAPARPSW